MKDVKASAIIFIIVGRPIQQPLWKFRNAYSHSFVHPLYTVAGQNFAARALPPVSLNLWGRWNSTTFLRLFFFRPLSPITCKNPQLSSTPVFNRRLADIPVQMSIYDADSGRQLSLVTSLLMAKAPGPERPGLRNVVASCGKSDQRWFCLKMEKRSAGLAVFFNGVDAGYRSLSSSVPELQQVLNFEHKNDSFLVPFYVIAFKLGVCLFATYDAHSLQGGGSLDRECGRCDPKGVSSVNLCCALSIICSLTCPMLATHLSSAKHPII